MLQEGQLLPVWPTFDPPPSRPNPPLLKLAPAERRADHCIRCAPLQLRYHEFLNKRHLVNPKKSGPFHHRAPSRILYRTIRGMVPHKVRHLALLSCRSS
jgi:hypothetical protein